MEIPVKTGDHEPSRNGWGWRKWLLIILFPIPFSPWWLTIIYLAVFCSLVWLLVPFDREEIAFAGVEAARLVEEALRSGCRVHVVLFSESGNRHHQLLSPIIDRPEMAFPTISTTDRLFEGLADTEHPQGVAALVHPRETSF